MKKPKLKPPPKPRNVAAKALAGGEFRPKIVERPDVYKRRKKHKPDLTLPPEGDAPTDETN